MGVSGVGKTTVGRAVAERFDWDYFDGDDFHPDENVEKMRCGTPLTDEDRAGWLDELRQLIARRLRDGRPAVIACSALKKAYRDRLRRGNDGAVIVYLRAARGVVEARIRDRTGHYFDASLLESQYAALEEPADAITVDATQPLADVVEDVTSHLERIASTSS